MKRILFAAALSCSSCAFGLNLNEALISAYETNDELKIARANFLNEIEAFPQALSAFLPDVRASVAKSDSKSKLQSKYQNGNSSVTGDLQRSLTISQNVFNGGIDTANLKAAQSAFRASRATYYATEQDIILKSIQAYVLFYSARQKYLISDISVAMNQKYLQGMKDKLRLGEATKTDLASAKAQSASAEAAKLKNYSDYQKAKSDFVRLFGVEPNDLELPAEPKDLPNSFDSFLAAVKERNPALAVARHKVSGAKAGSIAAKGALLPKVGLQFQAGKHIYDNENPFNQNLNSISVTSRLSVDIPIYSKGGSDYSKIRQAANSARVAAISLDAQEKQILSFCTAVWEGFKAGKSAAEAAAEAVESARLAYEGALLEEKVGSKTILDVLAAEVKLSESGLQKVDIDANYILAAFQIKSLEGTLTAKSLKLPVKYFEPEREFKKIKSKIIIGNTL